MLSNEERSLLYLSCGYSNLISKNYQDAFDDYRKALDTLAGSKNPGIEFLISFGMAVSCDNLHLSCDSREHVLRIKKLIDASEVENAEADSKPQDDSEIVKQLRFLAHMSATEEMQDLLITCISEIFPSSSVSYSYPSLRNMTHPPLSSQMTSITKPCRSFWKTMKKIREEIVDTWNKIFSIYQDIKEIIGDLSGKQTQNQSPWTI